MALPWRVSAEEIHARGPEFGFKISYFIFLTFGDRGVILTILNKNKSDSEILVMDDL